MTPVTDVEHPFVGNSRTTIVVEPGGFGECGQDIELCEAVGCSLNCLQMT